MIEIIKRNVTVVGAGLAGVCSAIMAAREGATVSLVGDRPVLGGNSSSEIRMWTRGATGGGNLYAEEMGIIGEMKLENLYRNPEGNVFLWDEVLLDFVLQEDNISLFLNTYVIKIEKKSDNVITRAIGYQLSSEKQFQFESPVFIDSTGDGTIGFLAEAELRRGREGKEEFGEPFAPDEPDESVLGSSIFFQSKETKKPVRFISPSYAYPKEKIKQLINTGGRILNEKISGTDLWWLEYGGTLNTIADNQEIAMELKKISLGVWDYIKNSQEFEADNLTLEWIGNLPGKRESRRFIGDYILNQVDIIDHKRFADSVCYGGWYLDYHPPEGIYSKDDFCRQIPVTIYDIPMRCLYSKNISNLLFAGRDISTTHNVLTSTRIMNTCALTGQAAGMIASFVIKKGMPPCELKEHFCEEIRQKLLLNDMFIISEKNNGTDDKAKSASIEVSSIRRAENLNSTGKLPIREDIFILFPWKAGMGDIRLKMDINADTVIRAELYACERPEGFRLGKKIGKKKINVHKEINSWISFLFNINKSGSYYLILKRNHKASLHISKQSCTGVICGWVNKRELFNPNFRFSDQINLFNAQNLINGYNRPYLLPNLWMSGKVKEAMPEWINLSWEQDINLKEIRIFFNPDLSMELTNIRSENLSEHHGYIPRHTMPPELVRDYSIRILINDVWKKLVQVKENRKRMVNHKFTNIKTPRIRIEFEKTYGSPYIEVFEVRIY